MESIKVETFHEKLKSKMDRYVMLVYEITKHFPADERYGVTSQLRRAALSVLLNYIEGFARFRTKVNIVFLETSFASLKESEYLTYFADKQGYIVDSLKKEFTEIKNIESEITAMLIVTIKGKKEI